MTRAEAEAVVAAFTKYLAATAAAKYSNQDRGRQIEAKDAYESLIERLMRL